MGKRVLFNIPGFLHGGPQLVAVTIGKEIKFSLQTRDAHVAEYRRSVALAEMNKILVPCPVRGLFRSNHPPIKSL